MLATIKDLAVIVLYSVVFMPLIIAVRVVINSLHMFISVGISILDDIRR